MNVLTSRKRTALRRFTQALILSVLANTNTSSDIQDIPTNAEEKSGSAISKYINEFYKFVSKNKTYNLKPHVIKLHYLHITLIFSNHTVAKL